MVIGDAIAEARALAEFVSMPVCVTYLHNDAFPADHPLMCGPLGYQGHQGAMNIIAEADVVIALGMCIGRVASHRDNCAFLVAT